jgi:hypothetical protein
MNTISLSEDGAAKLWKQLGELQKLIEETGSEMREKFAHLEGVTEGLVKGAQEDVKFDIIAKVNRGFGAVNESLDRVEQMSSSIEASPILSCEVDFEQMSTNIEEGIQDATKQAMKASRRKVEAEAKIKMLEAEIVAKDAKIKEFRDLQERTLASKQKRSEAQKRVWKEGRRTKGGEGDEEGSEAPPPNKKVCMKPVGHEVMATPSRSSKPVSYTPPPVPRKSKLSSKAGAGKPESSSDEEDKDEDKDEEDEEDSE